jgi:hypothetical protein
VKLTLQLHSILHIITNSSARRQRQPIALRYKGHYPLSVTTAPSPSNIIWENLEVDDRKRAKRMSLTGLVTLICLLATFLVITWASRTKTAYQATLTDQLTCTSGIPIAHGIAPYTNADTEILHAGEDEGIYISLQPDDLATNYNYRYLH